MHLPLLLAVSIYGQTSGRIIQAITNPPVAINVVTNMRTITAGGMSTNAIKDRVFQVNSGASSVTDYQVSSSRGSTVFYLSTPLTTIDTNGMAFYTNNGTLFALAQTDYGTFVSVLNYVSNSAVSTTNFLGFDGNTLGSNIQFSITTQFTGKNSSNWPYNNPGTNTTVWTYPPTLSCIGQSSLFYQCQLIAPNVTLWNNHVGSPVGATVTFTDTNGVKRTATFTSWFSGPNDFALGILGSSMPSSVVPASVFHPTVTNYIPSSLLAGFVFWAHRNTAHMDLSYVTSDPGFVYPNITTPSGMVVLNARTNIFGNEAGATPGDSGSPVGVMINGGTYVALYDTTQSGDNGGDPVYYPTYWNFMAANINTNSLSVVVVTNRSF